MNYKAWTSLFLTPLLLIMLVGCSTATFDTAINIIEQEIPNGMILVNALTAGSSGNSQLDAIYQKVAAAAQVDLPAIQAAVDAYNTSAGKTSFAKVATAVSTFAGDVNKQFLAANQIVNDKTQMRVLVSVATFVNALSIAVAVAQAKSGGSTASPAIKTSQVLPYLDQNLLKQMAERHGFDYNEVISTPGL